MHGGIQTLSERFMNQLLLPLVLNQADMKERLLDLLLMVIQTGLLHLSGQDSEKPQAIFSISPVETICTIATLQTGSQRCLWQQHIKKH